MESVNKYLKFLSIAMLLLAFLWVFYVNFSTNSLDEEDTKFEITLISTDWFWEESAQDFSDIKLSNSLWKTTYSGEDEGNIFLNSIFRVQTPSGNLIFESQRNYNLNKKTGIAYFEDGGEKAHLFFPQGVKKEIIYDFWSNDASIPIKLEFESVENIGELETYLYVGQLTLDLTEGYSFEDGVPEIRKVISEQDNFKIWIEPTTGIIIKYDSSGVNNYHDSITGDFIRPRNKWRNVFDIDTINSRTQDVSDLKFGINLKKYFVPGLIFVASFIFFSLYKFGNKEDSQ